MTVQTEAAIERSDDLGPAPVSRAEAVIEAGNRWLELEVAQPNGTSLRGGRGHRQLVARLTANGPL